MWTEPGDTSAEGSERGEGPVIFGGGLIATGDAGEGGSSRRLVVPGQLGSLYRVLGSEAGRSPLAAPHVTATVQSNDRVARCQGASTMYPHPTVALGQVAVLCSAAHLPLQQLCTQRGRSRAMACLARKGPRTPGFSSKSGQPDSPPLMHGPWATGHGGLRAARESGVLGPWELASLPTLAQPWEPWELRHSPTPPSSARRQAFACPPRPALCTHVLSRPYTAN